MEQIHLSLVKLVINSILDPKVLDFETWVLDVFRELDFGRGTAHMVRSKMVFPWNKCTFQQ